MELFCPKLSLKDVLGLYLALETLAADERIEPFRDSLRAFLYERLSIADMEEPEQLYLKLGGKSLPGDRLSGEKPSRRVS